MKKINRILSFLLAVFLVFSLAPAASAENGGDHSRVLGFVDDEALELTFKEAVEILTAVEILDGAQPLEPEGTMTRDEAAKIVTRVCLGDRFSWEEISTMYGKYENPFSDVSAGQWSDGAIAYCVRTGLISGRGDGTFDPTGGMTGYEFGKMLLAAVGYGVSQELEISSVWDISGDLTTEDGLRMAVAALDQPIVTMENGKVAYGETLAERNYGMTVDRIARNLEEGTFQLPAQMQAREIERLDKNLHFSYYTDYPQSKYPAATQFVVSANMIPTYTEQDRSYVLPEEKYTWADAAQFIATLELGEEAAAKLTDGGMDYCVGKGYIPADQKADDPITGTDLTKIMCTLLGNFWLDSAAGQFAKIYGLLEGVTGKLGTANTELETMEAHTALNALLAEPLNRDNAMQMIYNFLNAKMEGSEETVAERFGVDPDKYQPLPEALTQSDYVTVNVTVKVPADGSEFSIGIYPAGNNDAPFDPEGFDAATDISTYTVELPADTEITVGVIEAIITQILSGNNVIFDVTEEASAPADGGDHTLSSGSNGAVSWEVTENGMNATFNSGAENVTVDTAPLVNSTATVIVDEDSEIDIQLTSDPVD